jgi:hypothetical protein
MFATTGAPAVAKKRARPEDVRSVKLPGDVMDTARVVAALRNESIIDLLGTILRPALAKLERDEMAKRAKRTAEG